jgi:hypothetical protein
MPNKHDLYGGSSIIPDHDDHHYDGLILIGFFRASNCVIEDETRGRSEYSDLKMMAYKKIEQTTENIAEGGKLVDHYVRHECFARVGANCVIV